MTKIDVDSIPLSKFKQVKGTRHVMREKILQILASYEVSETPWTILFEHIFYRDFNFGDDEEKSGRILTADEVLELEADVPVEWVESEVEYARTLLENAVLLKPKIDQMLAQVVPNWEYERIAFIDRLIIQFAVTELIYGYEVPIKVSINEAIELAKQYSTAKSGFFINGVLEKMIGILKEENAINKIGKGLKT